MRIYREICYMLMVRKERLELSRLSTLEPKSSASTNSATFAHVTNKNITTKQLLGSRCSDFAQRYSEPNTSAGSIPQITKA